MMIILWLLQVCLRMHKAQCNFGNLWQLRIQLMAKALAEMAFIKMLVVKWEGDAFSCKSVQVKELTHSCYKSASAMPYNT